MNIIEILSNEEGLYTIRVKLRKGILTGSEQRKFSPLVLTTAAGSSKELLIGTERRNWATATTAVSRWKSSGLRVDGDPQAYIGQATDLKKRQAV